MNDEDNTQEIAFIIPEPQTPNNSQLEVNTQVKETKQEKEEKKRKLTKKQRLWLKYYLETGNKTESAIRAYELDRNDDSQYEVASNIGYQNYRKLEVDSLMEDMGLSDVFLLKVLAQGIVKPTKYEKVKGSKYEEEYKEVADYATRHRYLETALKVKKKIGNQVDNNQNTFNFEDVTFQFVSSNADNKEPVIDGEIKEVI